MGGQRLNFEDVESYADMQVGEYVGHIEQFRYRPARDGKSPQLAVTLEADEGEAKGSRCWQNLYLTDKAMGRVAKFFAVFGISDVELEWDDEDPNDVTNPDLTGEPVRFRYFRDGSYQGAPSYKAEVIEWLGGNSRGGRSSGSSSKPASTERKRSFR